MINGNRINDATYDQGPTGRDFPLDIDLIERIEFIPGPGSAVYGQNAMLGVVNIITRKGSDVNGAEISASYQTTEIMPQERVTFGKKFDNGTDALISFSGVQARGANRFFEFCDTGIAGVAHPDSENVKQMFARASHGPFSLISSTAIEKEDRQALINPIRSYQDRQRDRLAPRFNTRTTRQ